MLPPELAARARGRAERLRLRLSFGRRRLHQDLDPLFGRLELLLARPRELDAFLEMLEGLLEAQLAALQAFDGVLQLLQGTFKAWGSHSHFYNISAATRQNLPGVYKS